MMDSPIDPAEGPFHHLAMPEIALVALYLIVILLGLILVAMIRLGSKLEGFSYRLKQPETALAEHESAPEPLYDGAFGKFLGERPELLVLKKSEQFAAFRKWRKEQGLNWEGK
jgi:hypothetical protein